MKIRVRINAVSLLTIEAVRDEDAGDYVEVRTHEEETGDTVGVLLSADQALKLAEALKLAAVELERPAVRVTPAGKKTLGRLREKLTGF